MYSWKFMGARGALAPFLPDIAIPGIKWIPRIDNEHIISDF